MKLRNVLKELKLIATIFVIMMFLQFLDADAQTVKLDVNYKNFLAQHDMVWTRIPNRWELGPFSGNGNVGFLFYQAEKEAKNIISIYASRHDYYDHREAPKENQMLWIYRSRLPLGHFNLESKGNIKSVNLKLSLWNAELTGEIKTSKGSYQIRGLTHSNIDVLYFEIIANDGEAIKITWDPEKPIPPVWESLMAGGGPEGSYWDGMRTAPMPMAPPPVLSKDADVNYCKQMLYNNRGETTTGWSVKGNPEKTQQLTASIHHSFPAHNSLQKVKGNLKEAARLLDKNTFFKTHQAWWHQYYPLSFLTFNDTEKEAFYWIQMYKFASATRENGPVMDLMGPWYHRTFWPMVWGDLNVQLQYWTQLTSNRLSVGASLVNSIDKYAANLEGNVPEQWKESASIAALFPQDLNAYNGGTVPDMLAWILNNYWLQCKFAGDDNRMRDKLFPLLKKTMNSYLNYLKENPVNAADGKIHIKNSWSPEYPTGHGQDINFTLALIRWSCQTLLDINTKNNLQDPLAEKWKNLLDNLVEFQVDEDGLRIGKDIPFSEPHRHYSHLLAFYPLAVITPETEANKKLLKTTLDHWLDVSINSIVDVGAMKVTGYTATGAASLYALLADGENAYKYLNFFINHKNVSPTTMYAEGNPVIESPLSFATSIHDMLLQSWGGKIRVFPGVPSKWKDVALHHLRTQGAFLVSAKRFDGKTQFVEIESLVGSPCEVHVDISNPHFYINGKDIRKKELIKDKGNGFYQIDLKKGEKVILSAKKLKDLDLSIQAHAIIQKDANLFGLNEKTRRLAGDEFYSK